MNVTAKSRLLRELIQARETLVMPDAFDPLSARIIESLGFPAVQCSGFSMALAAMRPTEADLGLAANLGMTQAIVAAVQVPVMADGEDGFGEGAAVAEAIRAFVAAGVARVSLPSVAVFAALRAMTDTLRSIWDTGDFAEAAAQNRFCDPADIAALRVARPQPSTNCGAP